MGGRVAATLLLPCCTEFKASCYPCRRTLKLESASYPGLHCIQVTCAW